MELGGQSPDKVARKVAISKLPGSRLQSKTTLPSLQTARRTWFDDSPAWYLSSLQPSVAIQVRRLSGPIRTFLALPQEIHHGGYRLYTRVGLQRIKDHHRPIPELLHINEVPLPKV